MRIQLIDWNGLIYPVWMERISGSVEASEPLLEQVMLPVMYPLVRVSILIAAHLFQGYHRSLCGGAMGINWKAVI
jgi:hypothetical protein